MIVTSIARVVLLLALILVSALAIAWRSTIANENAEEPVCWICLPWDHPDRIERWAHLAVHGASIKFAVSGSAERIAATWRNRPSNELEVYNWSTGRLSVLRVSPRELRIFDPSFSPDGRYLAFSVSVPSYRGVSRLVVFDLQNQEVAAVLGDGAHYIVGAAFTASGDEILAFQNRTADWRSETYFPEYRENQLLQLVRYPLNNPISVTEDRLLVRGGFVISVAADGTADIFKVGALRAEGEDPYSLPRSACHYGDPYWPACRGRYLHGDLGFIPHAEAFFGEMPADEAPSVLAVVGRERVWTAISREHENGRYSHSEISECVHEAGSLSCREQFNCPISSLLAVDPLAEIAVSVNLNMFDETGEFTLISFLDSVCEPYSWPSERSSLLDLDLSDLFVR